MDWSNETYVRIYTRDSGDLLAVGWEGRAVLWELMRKADRAGVIDHGGEINIVAEMIRMPHDLVSTAIERLAKRDVILLRPTAIVIKNFLAAHEASKSDKQRQKESREKRLALSLASGADPATAKAAARPDYYRSQDVTVSGHETGPSGHETGPSGHAWSQPVTPGHSELSCAVQSGGSSVGFASLSPSLFGKEDKQSSELKAKRKRKPHPTPPDSGRPPLPFTVDELGQALARGAGAAVALDSWDTGLAKPVTRVIRELGKAERSLDDVEAGGRVIAGWKLGEPLTWSWIAKAGNLAGVVAKARNGIRVDAAPTRFEEWK